MEELTCAYNWNIHRPFHIYEGFCYFVTGRCYDHISHFGNGERKLLLQNVLARSVKRFQIKIFSWVILNDHYHLLFGLPNKYDRNDEMVDQEEAEDFVNNNETNFVLSDSIRHSSKNNNNDRNDEMSPANFVDVGSKKAVGDKFCSACPEGQGHTCPKTKTP